MATAGMVRPMLARADPGPGLSWFAGGFPGSPNGGQSFRQQDHGGNNDTYQAFRGAQVDYYGFNGGG